MATKAEPCIEETQPDAVPSEAGQQKGKRGQKTAENIRYGEAISEHGFGGETTGNSGVANQDGFGLTEVQEGEENAEKSRQEQGYGKGSGVGA
ncbi:MAG: hypothetical protein Q9187_000175 [Circinaria calcarea]